ETFHVSGNFVFVAEEEIIGVIENFLGRRVGQGDFTFHGDEHGGRAGSGGRGGGSAGADEKKRHRFDGEHFTAQYGVGTFWHGNNFVVCAGQKFVDGGRSQALLDAIAG